MNRRVLGQPLLRVAARMSWLFYLFLCSAFLSSCATNAIENAARQEYNEAREECGYQVKDYRDCMKKLGWLVP